MLYTKILSGIAESKTLESINSGDPEIHASPLIGGLVDVEKLYEMHCISVGVRQVDQGCMSPLVHPSSIFALPTTSAVKVTKIMGGSCIDSHYT